MGRTRRPSRDRASADHAAGSSACGAEGSVVEGPVRFSLPVVVFGVDAHPSRDPPEGRRRQGRRRHHRLVEEAAPVPGARPRCRRAGHGVTGPRQLGRFCLFVTGVFTPPISMPFTVAGNRADPPPLARN